MTSIHLAMGIAAFTAVAALAAAANAQSCRIAPAARFAMDFSVVGQQQENGGESAAALTAMVNEDCDRAKTLIEDWWTRIMAHCKPEYDRAISEGLAAPNADEATVLTEAHADAEPCRRGFIRDHFNEIAAEIR